MTPPRAVLATAGRRPAPCRFQSHFESAIDSTCVVCGEHVHDAGGFGPVAVRVHEFGGVAREGCQVAGDMNDAQAPIAATCGIISSAPGAAGRAGCGRSAPGARSAP